MDIKYLKLKLISGNKTLELGNKNYKIFNVDGLDYPDLELTVNSNAHYDGGVVTNRRVDKRYINLQSDYKGDGKEIERERLISFFNPKNKGKLIVDYCGLRRSIEYEVENFNSKLVNVYDDLSFTVDLICPDPFWQDLKEHETTLVTWIPNLEFPAQENKGIEFFHTEQTPNYWLETSEDISFAEFVTEFGRGIGQEWGYRELKQIVEVNNVGDVKCPIRIVFRANGDVEKPYIQDVETYELIRINRTLKSGDVLEITTGYGNKNVFLNGKKAHQYLDFLNSSWLQLKPGGNLIKYGAEKGLENLECTIFYTPLYLGV